MSDGVSVPEIARQTGMEVHTVRRWIEADGLKPVREEGTRKIPYYDLDAALKAVLPHKGAKKTNGNSIVDPKTGLTWHQAKLREEAISKRRENERAERLEADELMLTADHHSILSAVIGRLEQIPGKAQSELGLNLQQVTGLRRMLDEARENAASEIER